MPNHSNAAADRGNGIDCDGSTRVMHDPGTWNMHSIARHKQSAPYARWHHYAEYLKTLTNMCPRILNDHLDQLMDAATRYIERYVDRDPVRLGPRDIKAIIRSVNKDWVRKYGERWIQIKCHICGVDYDNANEPLMPPGLVQRLHERYVHVSKAFDYLKRIKHPLFLHRKNVPQLHAVTLQLLAQEGYDLVGVYGWCMPLLRSVKSRLVTEYRIRVLMRTVRRICDTDHGERWVYVPILCDQDKDLFTLRPEQPLKLLQSALRQWRNK